MIKAYTDGAYSSSREQGGWGFVIVEDDKKIHHDLGGVKDTTNNRMEMRAVYKAIEWLQDNDIEEAEIITDSMYVIGCMTKGWKRKKNVDMWIEMDELDNQYPFKHVKGHSGDRWNEYCDMIAVHGRDLIL